MFQAASAEPVGAPVLPAFTVSAQFAASLPGILLDADRFKQAVRNVIVNAADAMPQGGTLSVTTRSMDAGSTLVLEICDDGVGVDPAVVNPAELLGRPALRRARQRARQPERQPAL